MKIRFVPLISLVLIAWALAGCRQDGDPEPTPVPADAGPQDASNPDVALFDATDEVADLPPDAGVGADTGDGAAWVKPGPWAPREIFEPSGPFVEAHPDAFSRMSHWVTHVSGPGSTRPEVADRGAFGVGNGWSFGMIGLGDPLNTLHGLTGPTYDKGSRFFGDYAVALVGPDGAALEFDEEWATLSLEAPVVATGGQRGTLSVETLSFAPLTEDPFTRACILRVVTVTNTGTETVDDVAFRVRAGSPSTHASSSGGLLERTGERALATAFSDGVGTVDGRNLLRALGPLPAGDSETLIVAHCAAEGDDAEVPADLDVDALFHATVEGYQRWASTLVQVAVPNPLIADAIDGMKMTLWLETSAQGATCPMSLYTGTWTRDNIGPVLALLALGGHEWVRSTMDYLYGAVVLAGDLGNSYAADLDLSELPPPPDWQSLGPLTGRTAAETPSYMVWIYGAYAQHSGDLQLVSDRFGLLRRCVLDQDINGEGLLPFTGDETFRAAMNASFGLPLEAHHAERSWSANSSLLWLGAAARFIELAEATGHGEDAARARDLQALVESGVEEHYLLADGCLSPFRDRETGQSWPDPFEDVALKVVWAGWRDGDDPMAQRAMECLIERLGVEPGWLISDIDTTVALPRGLPDADRVYTGMLPGYTLAALTEVGHPQAADALWIMGDALTSSGSSQEYNIQLDGHRSGLTAIYDPTGAVGDYTAKFRPWEGGINVAAILGYLGGFEPDEPHKRFAVRPHLPFGWPQLGLSGLRSGDARFDLQVTEAGAGVDVELVSYADEAYDVELRWDSPGGALQARVDGIPIEEGEIHRWQHYGTSSVAVSGVLEPGQRRVWSFSP